MKFLMSLLLACVVLPVVAQETARPMSFDGCRDRAGNVVPAVTDTQLPYAVRVVQDGGKASLHYNPAILTRLLPETWLFVFAHECARQFLGFPYEGERTLAQARQADCWAMGTLQRSGALGNPGIVAAIDDDLRMVPEDWARLPGPEREPKLASCAAPPAATKGALRIDGAAPADDKWDRCAQACGARLYSCGRSASCEAAFTQCTAACGDK